MRSSTVPLVLWLALVAGLLSPLARGQGLETFVYATGGDAASGGPPCWGGAAPPPVAAFFGPYGVGVPNGGLAACGLAGAMRTRTASVTPLSDSMTLSTSWAANTIGAATSVRALYGSVRARAGCTFTGSSTSLYYQGCEGFSKFRDGLVFTSPGITAGQPGSIRLLVAVDGGLRTTGPGTADIELIHRQNGGSAFTLFRAQVNGANQLPFLTSETSHGLAGFTLLPGSMSGSDVVDSLPIQIVFGSSLDLELGLLAFVIPGSTSDLDVSFDARVVGFLVFDSLGRPVTTFKVASSSGASYRPAKTVIAPFPPKPVP